ncbi:MAG: PEP-CTERM sorting domain-containing protein [Pirellulales bacterium]|nr:PEP-CTERM sorting domain-containing protein [Pirellulales bacterium]
MAVGQKLTLCLALIAVIGLGVTTASANLADYASYAYDVNPPVGYSTWAGSYHVDQTYGGVRIEGNLDWAVFEAATFATLFPDNHPLDENDYVPTAGQLVYTYQLHNGDSSTSITLHKARIQDAAPVSNIGWFEHTAPLFDVLGQVPLDSYFSPAPPSPPAWAIWDFQAPCEISPEESSVGLAFCSSREPTMGFNISVDHGMSVIEIAGVPGAVPIPEPSSFILLTIAAAIMGLGYIRCRCRK